jgi:hypothetical protein
MINRSGFMDFWLIDIVMTRQSNDERSNSIDQVGDFFFNAPTYGLNSNLVVETDVRIVFSNSSKAQGFL